MTLGGNTFFIFDIYFALFWFLGKKNHALFCFFKGSIAGNASWRKNYSWATIAVFLQLLEGWWNWDPSQSCRNAVGQNFSPIYYKHSGLDRGGGSKTELKMRAAISHTGMNPTHLMQRVFTLLGMRRRGNHSPPGGKLTPARGFAWSCPVEGNGRVWKPTAPQILHWEGSKWPVGTMTERCYGFCICEMTGKAESRTQKPLECSCGHKQTLLSLQSLKNCAHIWLNEFRKDKFIVG